MVSFHNEELNFSFCLVQLLSIDAMFVGYWIWPPMPPSQSTSQFFFILNVLKSLRKVQILPFSSDIRSSFLPCYPTTSFLTEPNLCFQQSHTIKGKKNSIAETERKFSPLSSVTFFLPWSAHRKEQNATTRLSETSFYIMNLEIKIIYESHVLRN